jgi:hypothetical protein
MAAHRQSLVRTIRGWQPVGSSDSVTATPAPPPQPASRRTRRWLAPAAVIGGLATATGIALVAGSWSDGESDEVLVVESGLPAVDPPPPPPPDAGVVAEGEIVVIADVDQPVIEIDGQVVARFARRAVVPVAIGRHDVRVSAAGHVPFHTRVEVAARVRLEVHAVLRPEKRRRH